MKKKFLSVVLIAVMLAGIFALDSVVAPGKASAAVGDSITVQFEGKGYVSDNSLVANTIEYLRVVNTNGYGDYRPVFCGEHDKTGDPELFNKYKDTKTYKTTSKVTLERIRKVLYYGYEGPAEWSGFMTYKSQYGVYREQYYGGSKIENTTIERACKTGITANALSYVVGTASNKEKYPGVDAFLKYIDSKPAPPSNFDVYQINGGNYQHLFTWQYTPVGYAQIIKTSSMPEVTNGNGYYGNINNAVFGVYDGNTKIGEIKANGPAVEFPVGNYTVREINVPTNFFEMEVRNGEIVSGVTKKWEYENVPKMDPVTLLLKKVKKDGTTSTKLAGAEYTVKYYAGTSATGTPERTWVMKTDANGLIRMNDAHKVSGDAFYYMADKVTVGFPYGTVTIQETKAPAGFLVNPEVITVKVDGKTQAFSQTNAPVSKESEYGAIRIKKVDQNGKAMSGVVFNVYTDKACTNKVAAVTTNTNGEATYGYNSATGEYTLEPGKTFYFKEASTLPGYQISTEVFPVTVVDGKTTRTEKNAVNKELGAIRIRKVDQNGKAMSGVSFNVYTDKACTNKVAGVTTNTEGFATYGYNTETKLYTLTPGKTYYFKEASTLPGYQISTEVFPVTVVSGQTTRTETNAVNKELGAIRIRKVDQNGKAMAGVSFNVYTDKACTNKVAGVTTNSQGIATYGYDTATKLYTLEPGKTYYFKEASTLAGYQISTEVFPVKVVSGKTTSAAKEAVNLQKGGLKIKKVDQEGNALSEAEFTVYSDEACTKAIGTMKTGDDGYATYGYDNTTKVYSLTPGETYYVRETKAPAGFIPTDEVFAIKIESGKITEAEKEAVNKPLKISKSNIVTGEPVEGATIIIKDAAEKVVFTGKTDKNGDTEKITLPPGTYTFTEGEAPEGYIKTDEEFTFTIEDNGNITGTTRFTNEPVPEIKTTAMFEDVTKDSLPTGTITLIDKVKTGKLVIGKEYTVKGTLINKDDETEVIATAETTFTATETEMTVDVVFTFDASKLEGTTTVVFEDIYKDNIKLATHSEINDEDQTVRFPKIRTKVGESVMAADGVVTLTDTLTYENLTPGNTYKVSGSVMDKEIGELLVIDGKEVTAEAEFTPKEENGKVSVKFTFDASTLSGKSLVVFEKVIDVKTGSTIGKHEDLEDKDQTVDFPEIKTTAMFDTGEKESPARKEVTVIDKVEAKNLTIGKEYTVKGTLVNVQDEKDIIAKAETTFTATEKNMVIDVVFKFDGSKLEGESVVVFEDLLHNKKVVATHSELNDKDQTVKFPKAKTKVSDSSIFAGKVSLTDTIFYEGLTPGEAYTAKGLLVDQKGNPIKVDGKEVRAEAEFTPESENGTVDVTFEFDAKTLEGTDIVVFEEILNARGKVIAEHKDTEDKNQTVNVERRKIVKTGDDRPIFLFSAMNFVSLVLLMGVLMHKKVSVK